MSTTLKQSLIPDSMTNPSADPLLGALPPRLPAEGARTARSPGVSGVLGVWAVFCLVARACVSGGEVRKGSIPIAAVGAETTSTCCHAATGGIISHSQEVRWWGPRGRDFPGCWPKAGAIVAWEKQLHLHQHDQQVDGPPGKVMGSLLFPVVEIEVQDAVLAQKS